MVRPADRKEAVVFLEKAYAQSERRCCNVLRLNREQVISDCRLMLEMLTDHTKLDAQIAKANEEIALVSGLVSACVHKNAEKAQAQDEYTSKYEGLAKRYDKATVRLEKLNAERADKVNREWELRGFIDALALARSCWILVMSSVGGCWWCRGLWAGMEALSLSSEML
jgi:hypothetical protein